jgi:hypothetical protein
MMGKGDIADATIEAVELVLQELTIALVAAGALDRAEAVKAYLRAEVIAGLRDQVAANGESRAGYVRLLQSSIEPRLAAKPEFFALRQARERWREQGEQGSDPYTEQ